VVTTDGATIKYACAVFGARGARSAASRRGAEYETLHVDMRRVGVVSGVLGVVHMAQHRQAAGGEEAPDEGSALVASAASGGMPLTLQRS